MLWNKLEDEHVSDGKTHLHLVWGQDRLGFKEPHQSLFYNE